MPLAIYWTEARVDEVTIVSPAVLELALSDLGDSVAEVLAGSGADAAILAIDYASKLRIRINGKGGHPGAMKHVIDPVAVATAGENTRRNRARSFITFVQAAGVRGSDFRKRAPFDLIFANILLGPLVKLAAPLARLAAPHARIVLSGLLPSQANAVIAVCRAQGLHLEQRSVLDGWATLVMRRGNGRLA